MARQTSDYTKAASAVVQNMDSVYEAARSSSFKPDEVAKTIQNANTERYKAFLRSSGELLRTKNKNDSSENDRWFIYPKDHFKKNTNISTCQKSACYTVGYNIKNDLMLCRFHYERS